MPRREIRDDLLAHRRRLREELAGLQEVYARQRPQRPTTLRHIQAIGEELVTINMRIDEAREDEARRNAEAMPTTAGEEARQRELRELHLQAGQIRDQLQRADREYGGTTRAIPRAAIRNHMAELREELENVEARYGELVAAAAGAIRNDWAFPQEPVTYSHISRSTHPQWRAKSPQRPAPTPTLTIIKDGVTVYEGPMGEPASASETLARKRSMQPPEVVMDALRRGVQTILLAPETLSRILSTGEWVNRVLAVTAEPGRYAQRVDDLPTAGTVAYERIIVLLRPDGRHDDETKVYVVIPVSAEGSQLVRYDYWRRQRRGYGPAAPPPDDMPF